jgi:hypothetical protein
LRVPVPGGIWNETCARASALLVEKRKGSTPGPFSGLDELHGLRDAFLERVLALVGAEAPRRA